MPSSKWPDVRSASLTCRSNEQNKCLKKNRLSRKTRAFKDKRFVTNLGMENALDARLDVGLEHLRLCQLALPMSGKPYLGQRSFLRQHDLMIEHLDWIAAAKRDDVKASAVPADLGVTRELLVESRRSSLLSAGRSNEVK